VDGRGKIVLAARCILESEGNQDAFRQPFINAVMGAIREFGDRGLELIEAFDHLKLTGIWEQMRALEFFYVEEAPSALERIIRNKLRRILSPPTPEPVEKPSKKERIEADKQALASARMKLIEQIIALGLKLAALRDTMPSNQKFGAAVRKQFDLHDSLYVAEVMRVARRYGARPEIFRNVGWRVLVELASTVTSAEQRRQLEARILAGESVTGAEIVRARSSQKQARHGLRTTDGFPGIL
jgi:hypothetical protein